MTHALASFVYRPSFTAFGAELTRTWKPEKELNFKRLPNVVIWHTLFKYQSQADCSVVSQGLTTSFDRHGLIQASLRNQKKQHGHNSNAQRCQLTCLTSCRKSART